MSAVDRIRTLLLELGLDAVALSTRRNFAWLTQGGVSGVDTQTEAGVGTVVVSRDRVVLVTPHIEMDRLIREQLGGLSVEELAYDWWEDASLVVGRVLAECGSSHGSDNGIAGSANIGNALSRVRAALGPDEHRLFRSFAKDTSVAIESVLVGCTPGMTEKQVEILVWDALMQRGIRPAVLQVGSDERLGKYAHALATDKVIQKHLRVAVCGEKFGLVTSSTRAVYFGPVDAELTREYRATGRLIATMTGATSAGMPWSALWNTITDTYRESGYEDLWKTQHQGGTAAYAPREWLIEPTSQDVVSEGQAYAWNPILRNAKCEDTMLVTASGPEIISLTGTWPTVSIETPSGTFHGADLQQL